MHAQRQSLASTSSSLGSLIQTKNSDVVKRGCLYVKRPPVTNPVKLRFKTWQKRYLILRDMWTDDGDTVLELYSSENAASSAVDDSCPHPPATHSSIKLKNVTFVDVYSDSRSFPYAFVVLRTGKSPLIFGAKTDLEMREWMMAIKHLADKVTRLRPTTDQLAVDASIALDHRWTNDIRPPPPRLETRSTLRKDDFIHRSTPQLMENSSSGSRFKAGTKAFRQSPIFSSKESTTDQTVTDLNSKFLVRVQKTADSSLHQLEGEYYMVVSDTEICLRESPTAGTAVISWPLRHIRKLKSEATTDGHGDLITLVAHSRCGQAQGTFTFRITSGLELIRRVRMFARRLESADSSCRRQQRDIAKLKSVASSSLERLLLPSSQDIGSSSQSMQSLVLSSESSSGSQLDEEEQVTSSSGQSRVCFFTGNCYLPVIDDSGNTAPSNLTLTGNRLMTLSRSMGSLGKLSTTSRRIDSGFESSEEVVMLNVNPPIPPPRPVHTIGLS